MSHLPAAARRFWWGVVIVGCTLLLTGAVQAVRELVATESREVIVAVAAFVAAGALAQTCRVQLPNPRRALQSYLPGGTGDRPDGSAEIGQVFVSLSSPVYVAIILAFPGWLAVVSVGMASALGSGGLQTAWAQRLFSVAQHTLATSVAALIWQLAPFAVQYGLPLTGWLAPTLVAYLLVNSALIGIAGALSDRLPVRHAWLSDFRDLLPSYLLLLTAGGVFWALWLEGLLVPGGLVLLIGIAGAYRSLRYAVLLQQETITALTSLANLMDQRDYYTHQHSLRVGRSAERLAASLGCSRDEARTIFLSGRLHDIGKCAVRNEVLLKPGPLDAQERAEMASHAEIGGRMLAHFSQFREGAMFVRSHHEWYDGSGYPDGLARGRIPLGARIIAVADAYDAMTTDRPYRKALPRDEAIRRLRAGAGSQWDPRVVQKFLELLGEPPLTFSPDDPLARRSSLRRAAAPLGA